MVDIKDKTKCCGCSACVNICPQNCISMERDKEGFLYPVIDKQKCVKCNLCSKICPILLQKAKCTGVKPKTFASKNNDDVVRACSSSGGIFTLLAEYVINKNGVVFGVGFDKNFKVCHQFIENIEDLPKLRGSKYVQSEIGKSYKQAKAFLDAKRLVLFTGTLCQISGLKSYLKKDYENLITQDVICHGVPSPLLWEKYLDYLKSQNGGEISNIMFRDKSTGWKNYSFTIVFDNKAKYSKKHLNEPYLNMFVFNKSLRPSCYKCSFKGLDRQSDITLGDFWGSAIKKVGLSLNDNKGCTLVVVNSKKGQEIIDAIGEKITKVEISNTDAFRGNPMMKASAHKHFRRRGLMKNIIQCKNMEFIVKKYGKILF